MTFKLILPRHLVVSNRSLQTTQGYHLLINSWHFKEAKYEPPVWGTFTPPGDYKIVGYYAAWGIYMRQFFLSGADVSRLTHLNYAFANIRNGEVVIGDEWADPTS